MENLKTILALVAIAIYYVYRQYTAQQQEALKRKAEIEKGLSNHEPQKQPQAKARRIAMKPAKSIAAPAIHSLESTPTTYHNLEQEGIQNAVQHQHEAQTHLAYQLAEPDDNTNDNQNVINNSNDLRTMILHYEMLSAPKCLRA